MTVIMCVCVCGMKKAKSTQIVLWTTIAEMNAVECGMYNIFHLELESF
jgi:hypothetical protein